MDDSGNIHGTGIVVGGRGILLRGPSGAGKSLLALSLLRDAETRGEVAALVADDRIDLEVANGRLVMNAPPAIAGMIELRGRGIVSRPHVEKAEINLVVDLVDQMVRLVAEEELSTELLGVRVARCPVPLRSLIDALHQKLLVEEALHALGPARPPGKKTA